MADNDLNEVIEEEIDDAAVITVPIDDTLSNSGEAADAKAVGDALALKADKSELQTAITVNGQGADAQGAILVDGTEIPMSSSDQTTIKAAIEAVDGKTAEDIPVTSGSSQTIKQALDSSVSRTADQIPMSSNDSTTVKQKTDTLTGAVNDLDEAVSTVSRKTAAEILYNSGSEETIKQHVDAMAAGTVKTVNNIGPDADGDIEIERVPYADNLYTEDQERVDDSFLIRTAAGSGSLSDGNAWAQQILGNRVHDNFVAESIQMTVNAMPRTTPPAITVSIDQEAWAAAAETAGTYEFNYTTSWDVNPASYGLTITNDPVNGDKITVVWDGVNDATASVTAGPRTAPPAITATLDRDTFVAYVAASGTITLTYTTAWSHDPADYGITVNNTPIAGDQIVVVYVKEVRGTITVGHPTALVATGWNLYNHTAGYARVVKYSETYGYLVEGTYTSLAFAETPTGTQTAITPDADGLFNVPSDGYVIVTGGNNTDTAIVCTWSDWEEGHDGDWMAYQESSVSLSAIMTAAFPYGLCKLLDSNNNPICDEIDFVHKQAISRITRMAYSAENLATVIAAGRPYEYDEDYIYQVRASEVISSITVDEEYTVNEHGLEWFAGSDIELYAEILYGANLKDKLKRDVLTISEQTLTSGQSLQVRTNIGAGSATDVSANTTAVGQLKADIGIVEDTDTATHTIAKDQYVIWKGDLYKASAAIPSGTTLSLTNLTAVSGGLGSEVVTLSDHIANLFKTKSFTAHSSATWGSMPLPSGVTADKVLFAYPTGTYAYMAITVRGDGNMFCWFFNQNGVAEIAKDVDISGVIVYRE